MTDAMTQRVPGTGKESRPGNRPDSSVPLKRALSDTQARQGPEPRVLPRKS